MNRFKVGIIGDAGFPAKQIRHAVSMSNIEYRLYDPSNTAYSFCLDELCRESNIIFLTSPRTLTSHLEHVSHLRFKTLYSPVFVLMNIQKMTKADKTNSFIYSMLKDYGICFAYHDVEKDLIDSREVTILSYNEMVIEIMKSFYQSILDKPNIQTGEPL